MVRSSSGTTTTAKTARWYWSGMLGISHSPARSNIGNASGC
ncbi:hypothetical protein OZK63_03565 [Streptomyces sp. UMAF16]|nr:hypothetical protein [Streptomyces sp. UMAF16]